MKLRMYHRKDAFSALWFLAPSLIGFAIFYVVPFAEGMYYSFLDAPMHGSFVGLANYKELFQSDSFRKAALNTLLFTAVSVPLMLLLSLLLALLLNQNAYFRKWMRTAYVMPLVVPVASIVLIWQALFDWNGAVNAWFVDLGWARIDWMKSEWAFGVLVVVYLWKNIGYNIILFLAGLQSIPKDYYETAYLEGAGPLRRFTSITLVYLTPTMFFVVLMSVLNSFKVFRETHLIAGDYPHDSIYMLQHYMNNGFQSLDLQKLSSAAVVMVACILLGVSVFFWLEHRFRQFME
ncbi:carbohydrate ABC transporter permease [Paenibacillus puldeungensis]|uniref:Carbohydrate ABC transporter permease n=1 Tax=Paenibacillus puldeungensis TaxID=696536 RepID=A0ABW3RW84_9BACL